MTGISWLDWKLGARLLVRQRVLTLVGGLSLAAAIGFGAVGVEVAGELLYKPLPFEDGDRIVRLETLDVAASRVEQRVLRDLARWRQSLRTVTELGAVRVGTRNLVLADGRTESLRVAEITASAFPLTRVQPVHGRPLQASDEMPGAPPVVVLGHDVWQRIFLGDPAVVGRLVTVGRSRRTVVGVMPDRFGFPYNQQAWVPLPISDAPPREGPGIQVFGRLAPGSSWPEAAAELDVESTRAAAAEPATHANLRTRVRAFAGRTPGDPLRLEDWLIHAIVFLLLGAVSANVAALVFARTAMRESEMVIRHALGASRSRVVAQIVSEAFVLTLAAAVMGLLGARIALRFALARATTITGEALPFWVDLGLEPATVAYAFLLAFIAAGAIGLLPALRATRTAVRRGLQGTTSTGGAMTFGGAWSFMIGAQVAFTLLCLPATVGIATNVLGDRAGWTDFPAEEYVTFRLEADNEALAGEDGAPDEGQIALRRAQAYAALADRLRQEPGVTDVTYGDRLPTTSPEWVAIEVDDGRGAPAPLDGNFEGGFAMAAVGTGYHEAFGAAIVTGRALTAADHGAANRPVVVNESFMRLLGRNPVGTRVRTLQRGRTRAEGPWQEIVGVVTDLWTFPADWSQAAFLYRAVSAADVDPLVVAVRSAGDATLLAPRLVPLARQVDVGLTLRDVEAFGEAVARARSQMASGIVVFGGVLLIALCFAAAGLYALMAVAVERRTREIGIRVALGARPQDVLRSVFRRAGRQLGGGIVAGDAIVLLIAWNADALTPTLVGSLTIMSVIVAAVGLAACAGPARRALAIQPTDALRHG